MTPTSSIHSRGTRPVSAGDGSIPDVLHPPASLGVIGSGQLGRMFIQAAQRMGYRAGVLSTSEDTPAAQVAHWTVIGPPDHLPALGSFSERAEAVTVEFENVSAPALRWLARRRPVRPGWRTVWTSQNRLREKTFLARNAIPHAPWRPVRTEVELEAAVRDLGVPLILKTASSGYDGKGQVLVDRAADAGPAWSSLGRVACVAEGWVEFAAELSVVVARGRDGHAVTYPVGLNHHERHILDTTVMPAPVGPIVASRLAPWPWPWPRHWARSACSPSSSSSPPGAGYGQRDRPRPHNSGHLTVEAAYSSQFEQQVRALCGLPLGSSDLVMPAAMVNLLGDLWAGGEPRWDAALRLDPGVKLHLYGKQSAKPGRKMGHLTVLDPVPEHALARALAARRALVASH